MKRTFVLATFALLLATTALGQQAAEKQKAAEVAARSWLALVDRADYAQSWQQAAAFFQSKVAQGQWVQMVESVRGQTGTISDRKLASMKYQTELPGAPNGEYVIIQYKASAAGVGPVIETVVPMLDKDGKWRVSGYYVKPAQ